MATDIKERAIGKLPFVVAYAVEARVEPQERMSQNAAHYTTYTTDSGSGNSRDDAPIKDES